MWGGGEGGVGCAHIFLEYQRSPLLLSAPLLSVAFNIGCHDPRLGCPWGFRVRLLRPEPLCIICSHGFENLLITSCVPEMRMIHAVFFFFFWGSWAVLTGTEFMVLV